MTKFFLSNSASSSLVFSSSTSPWSTGALTVWSWLIRQCWAQLILPVSCMRSYYLYLCEVAVCCTVYGAGRRGSPCLPAGGVLPERCLSNYRPSVSLKGAICKKVWETLSYRLSASTLFYDPLTKASTIYFRSWNQTKKSNVLAN